MPSKQEILDWYPEEEFMFADGLDNAILGVDEKTMRIIYSVQDCIDCLMINGIDGYEAAEEYFNYNVRGAYVGEKTPIWCDDSCIGN